MYCVVCIIHYTELVHIIIVEAALTRQSLTAGDAEVRTYVDVTRNGIVMYANLGNISHFHNLKTNKRMPSVCTKVEDMVRTKITCVAYYNGQAIVGTNIGRCLSVT